MKVSIITVSYNAVTTIEQTICSVLNQTYKDIEYIIIDGGSTDGTCNIIEKYRDKLSVYISEPDNGIYDAMNKGIEYSAGDIIGIINSDDWYEYDAVEKIVKCFETNDAELVYGRICTICKDGSKKISQRMQLDEIYYQMALPHPSVFVKREVYRDHGVFDVGYEIAADYDLLLRFYVQGVKFQYVDDIIANFRYGGISTVNVLKCANESCYVSLSHLNKCPIETRKDVLNRINKKYNNVKFRCLVEEKPEIFGSIIERFFNNAKDGLIIWGTGIWGDRCYKLLKKCNIPILKYVDNNKEKWGHYLNGIEIASPEILKDGECCVLVAVLYQDSEIEKVLKSFGNQGLIWTAINDFIACSSLLEV